MNATFLFLVLSKSKTVISMKQYLLISLMTIFILESCKKEPKENKTDPGTILRGWQITKTKYDFNIIPDDLFFINSAMGFVVGYNGEIYKTINSGSSWQEENSGTTLHLFSVYFINENIGFVSGEAMSGCLDADCGKGAVFLKTADGGKTWTKFFFKDYVEIYSLHFFNESTGIALIRTPDIPNSSDYHIAKTENGGQSWEIIDLPVMPNTKIFSVDNTAYVPGNNRNLYKSSDQGESWQSLSTPISVSDNIEGLYFYSTSLGFVSSGNESYKTMDGGSSWKPIDFPFSSFGVFHFYNESEGFNVVTVSEYDGGDFPTFKGSQSFQTLNGCKTWYQSALNDSLFLGLTSFPQRDLGYGMTGAYFYTIKKN
jgi:photosystem II stability/assembly factor-like uncharacterized protein